MHEAAILNVLALKSVEGNVTPILHGNGFGPNWFCKTKTGGEKNACCLGKPECHLMRSMTVIAARGSFVVATLFVGSATVGEYRRCASHYSEKYQYTIEQSANSYSNFHSSLLKLKSTLFLH
jgi:hypothetical protein